MKQAPGAGPERAREAGNQGPISGETGARGAFSTDPAVDYERLASLLSGGEDGEEPPSRLVPMLCRLHRGSQSPAWEPHSYPHSANLEPFRKFRLNFEIRAAPPRQHTRVVHVSGTVHVCLFCKAANRKEGGAAGGEGETVEGGEQRNTDINNALRAETLRRRRRVARRVLRGVSEFCTRARRGPGIHHQIRTDRGRFTLDALRSGLLRRTSSLVTVF